MFYSCSLIEIQYRKQTRSNRLSKFIKGIRNLDHLKKALPFFQVRVILYTYTGNLDLSSILQTDH
jgi:hypothetical protein